MDVQLCLGILLRIKEELWMYMTGIHPQCIMVRGTSQRQSLHTVWFHLLDILEKAKLQGQRERKQSSSFQEMWQGSGVKVGL